MLKINKLLPLLACSLPLTGWVAEPTLEQFNARLTALEKQVKKRRLYNAPAHAQILDGYNVFLTGEVLYWKAQENGLTYAVKVKHPTTPLRGSIDLKDPHFRWDIGFRAGLGFNLAHDHWDLILNWTRFYTGAHATSHTTTNEELIPVDNFPAGPLGTESVTESKTFWKLFLNILDVELGKEYYVGKKLSLRPHLDLRTVFVNQRWTTDYNDSNQSLFDCVQMKNNYWGVGPRTGLNFQWWLKNGFSFYGNGSMSLVYGNMSNHQREEMKNMPEEAIRFHKHLHMAHFIADLGLFFGWDQMLFHDTCHIGIKAGWEQLVFFEQNQFVRFLNTDFQGSLVSNQGNLMLQGWTFSLRLDF